MQPNWWVPFSLLKHAAAPSMVSYILSLILWAEAEIITTLILYKQYFIFGHTYVKRHMQCSHATLRINHSYLFRKIYHATINGWDDCYTINNSYGLSYNESPHYFYLPENNIVNIHKHRNFISNNEAILDAWTFEQIICDSNCHWRIYFTRTTQWAL